MKSTCASRPIAVIVLFIVIIAVFFSFASCGKSTAVTDESGADAENESIEESNANAVTESKDESIEESVEESAEEISLPDDEFGDGTSWVFRTYYNYIKEKQDWSGDISDLYFQQYVGTFGEGCVVAYIGGDDIPVTDEYRTEVYGEHTITFRDGQICYAFYNGEALTIGQAYERGILGDADILAIDAAVGLHLD